MIKINLIAQRRVRSDDPGQIVLLAAFASIFIAAALVYFFVHRPLVSEVEAVAAQNAKLQQENQAIEARTKDYKALQAAVTAAEQQKDAIDELNDARAVPAWLLDELSRVLTTDGRPTMTDEMARRVRNDPNRAWAEGWDPKNVWITSFAEAGGRFRLQGSAQADSDMTQLALRLQASTFFEAVVPEGGSTSGRAGVSLYKFTISGRVRY